MTVALIDTGVSIESNVAECWEVDNNLNIVSHYMHYPISSHGSICSAIIKKHCPNCQLISIKIMEINDTAPIIKIAVALQWCLDRGIKVVNLSAGSFFFQDEYYLLNIIDICARNGMILICASANNGYKTYPACFTSVLGVECDRSGTMLEGTYIKLLDPFRNIDFRVGNPCLVDENSISSFSFSHFNSYAAPIITAKTINILNRMPLLSVYQVKSLLSQNVPLLKINHSDIEKRELKVPVVCIHYYDAMPMSEIEIYKLLYALKWQFWLDDYNAYIIDIDKGNVCSILNFENKSVKPIDANYIILDSWYSQADLVIISDRFKSTDLLKELDVDEIIDIMQFDDNSLSLKNHFDFPILYKDLSNRIKDIIISQLCEDNK